MNQRYIEPTQVAGHALFTSNIEGSITMLNLLRFKTIVDCSKSPELSPLTQISGREAFQLYINHTSPLLEKPVARFCLSAMGRYFIGPQEQRWDMMVLIRQNTLQDFLQFATDLNYLKGLGHRTAAISDS